TYLRSELEVRRQRLLNATRAEAANASLRELLSNVDAALARLSAGTFGICEECHDSIEADRLLCDPLVRFCLDHLSQDEQRARLKSRACHRTYSARAVADSPCGSSIGVRRSVITRPPMSSAETTAT